MVSKVPDAQVMGDLDAAVAWAARPGKADPSRLAITGFCWGGRIVWLYAAHSPKLKAGVAWYGRLVGQRASCTPAHPVDVAAALKVPVLGLYGGEDQGIPLATVEEMRTALAAGKARGVRRLSRSAARLPCRLPAQLHEGRGRGRLEAHASPGSSGMVLLERCPCGRCTVPRRQRE